MQQIIDRIRHNPAIVNAVLALVAVIVVSLVDVIELAGGELAALIAAFLGQGVITRQKVTPVG